MRGGHNTRDETPATGGHSTCVASKAFGRLLGAAKYATPVVVKMPRFDDASMIHGLDTIARHVKRYGREGRSIVNISWGSYTTYHFSEPHPPYRQQIYDLDDFGHRMLSTMRSLSALAVNVVCAAGNYAATPGHFGPRQHVDTIPAVFGHPDVISDIGGSIIAVGNSFHSSNKMNCGKFGLSKFMLNAFWGRGRLE